MYLNDLNSSQHNVKKLNKILSQTFEHDVNLSAMSTDSLNRMLNTTNAKMMAIKESDLKYWENPQYNKLGLISHQIKEYLSEIAPTRTDGKKMKKESTVMEADLDQAEVLLAAQELVDEMQGMVEDVAEMQVQKLMPIVDAMKEQVGFEIAETYNNAADAALGTLLDAMKTAKNAVEDATLAARGEKVAAPTPTDMGMDDDDMDPEAPMDMDADDFGGDDAEAGEDNPVGRELKGEGALADMEKEALAEKKFLESKDKLFKMVESGTLTHDQFINIVSEFEAKKKVKEDSKPEAVEEKGNPYKAAMRKLAGLSEDLPPVSQFKGMKDPYANLRKFQNRDMEGDIGSGEKQKPQGRMFVPQDKGPDFDMLDKDAYRVKPNTPIGGIQKLDLRKGDAGHSDAMKFYKFAKKGS